MPKGYKTFENTKYIDFNFYCTYRVSTCIKIVVLFPEFVHSLCIKLKYNYNYIYLLLAAYKNTVFNLKKTKKKNPDKTKNWFL